MSVISSMRCLMVFRALRSSLSAWADIWFLLCESSRCAVTQGLLLILIHVSTRNVFKGHKCPDYWLLGQMESDRWTGVMLNVCNNLLAWIWKWSFTKTRIVRKTIFRFTFTGASKIEIMMSCLVIRQTVPQVHPPNHWFLLAIKLLYD